MKIYICICVIIGIFSLNVNASNRVQTNIVAQMIFMDQGMVLANNNNGLFANEAAFAEGGPGARMMGFRSGGGANRRGLVYHRLSDLGMEPLQVGVYTLTLQVATNDELPWPGLFDTFTDDFERNAPGFAGGFFLEPDGQNRVAYTVENMNRFNKESGVSVSVVSDERVDVLLPEADLDLNTWYEVVYTWAIDDSAGSVLGEDAYIGMAGNLPQGTAGTVWIANSSLRFQPKTVRLIILAD